MKYIFDKIAIFAVFSKTADAVTQLNKNWSDVIPSTFPSRGAWKYDSENGVGICGNVTNSSNFFFATSTEKTVPNDKQDFWLGSHLSPSSLYSVQSDSQPFAILYWDFKQRYFFAARDPLGQSEMFCRETPLHLFFCSDLSLLLNDTHHPTTLNYEAAVHYLMFGRPTLGHSLAKSVTKLPAGQCLESYGEGIMSRRRYFTPMRSDSKKVLSNTDKEKLITLLDAVISKSTCPENQALLLSGGMDSSYIAYSIAQQFPTEGIDAYTVEFEYPYQENETKYASYVAQETGIKLNVVNMGAHDATNSLSQILKVAQPTSAWASLTHFHLLKKMSADGHSTFVSGLGADEVFGGYSRFLHFYRKLRYKEALWTEGVDSDYFNSILLNPRQATENLFPGVPEFFSQRDFRKASRAPFKQWSHYLTTAQFYKDCRELKPDSHLFELMVAHECQHRIPDLLFTSFECVGRDLGVIGRYPFLDKNIVEIACGLGAVERFWLNGKIWKNKRLLREVASYKLPRAILERSIGSYTTPITLWFMSKQFKEEFRSYLMEGKLWQTGIISDAWRLEVDTILFTESGRDTPKSKQSAVEQAWIMVTLAAWYEEWIA